MACSLYDILLYRYYTSIARKLCDPQIQSGLSCKKFLKIRFIPFVRLGHIHYTCTSPTEMHMQSLLGFVTEVWHCIDSVLKWYAIPVAGEREWDGGEGSTLYSVTQDTYYMYYPELALVV